MLKGRYCTINAIIRVNQIEVTETDHIGEDEREAHTPEYVIAFREAVQKGFPEGKITWAFSWLALNDPSDNYMEIRRIVKEYHHHYGDDITFCMGGFFPNAYATREQVSREMKRGIDKVCDVMGEGYYPRSIIAGFLSAENQRYLAEELNIHVCQGNIWSQFAIDNQDGDGSIMYPYFPSKEHFCKPSQNETDFIDCVNLDGWTVDMVCGRLEGVGENWNSRMGVGPIETLGNLGGEEGFREIVATTDAHFKESYEKNGFAWLTVAWEISLIPLFGKLEYLTKWLAYIRTNWRDAKIVPIGEFGLDWRKENTNNDNLDIQLVQRGSGVYCSDEFVEVRWYMNKSFRLGIQKDWRTGEELVFDFTRYDLLAKEPNDFTRRWSLLGDINQKQTRPQDKPIPYSDLTNEQKQLIESKYPKGDFTHGK